MRTTLTLDDDVFEAARAYSRLHGIPLGKVVSSLARQSLQPDDQQPRYRNGIRLLPTRRPGFPVTMELVNKLRDEYE